MSVPEFAPGTACGGALTSSQVFARQTACTEMAIAGMQNPQKYRHWKEAAMKQHGINLASTGFCWKAAKWLCIVTLIAGVAASTWQAATAHPSIIILSCRSAAEALFPLVPYSQTFSDEDAVSAGNMPTTTTPQQPVTSKLFPEIKQEVEALGGSTVDSTSWALEDSWFRAAELESDLASMHDENQQLSAHLLQAARQLAAVGQPVQLPEAKQTDPVQGLSSRKAAVLGMLLLMLPWALWGLLTSARRTPVTLRQQATNADSAADKVTSLQQHNSKLERQVKQQQQQLMHAEQTIMGLTSGKAQVEIQLRGSQQKVNGLQSDLARAECLLDSHAVAKLKLPLFPMSPLAAPPVRHDKDKENCGRPAKSNRFHAATPAFAKASSEKDVLLGKLRDMEAEKCRLEAKVASLEAGQAGLKDACRQADEQRTKMQLDAEALELRLFTTHEHLAVSEEKEADLAAQVQQAQQLAAAAQLALATKAQATLAAVEAEQDRLSSCIAHPDQQDQQPSQRQVEQKVMPAAEQAGLHSSQAATQELLMAPAASSSTADNQTLSASQTSSAGAESSNMATTAAAVHDATTAAPGCNHSMATTAVGDAATAAQYGSPATLRPIRTRRSSSSDIPKTENTSVSISTADPGHLAAGQTRLQASGRANSMQSSPIFGLASASSQAFTLAADRTAQMPKQGPTTPWSADWVTAFFSPGKSSVSRRRPGSISPTRLFDFNGDNILPEPEDLFKMAWQGQPK